MTMFQAIRRRIQVSPATAIATLALVFAMSGGAYAAGHYLITSTKQISPKVLKSLKGANGKNGTNGANGPAGAAGAGTAGAQGPAGPAGNAGSNGTNGSNGAPGESVTNTKLEPGKGGCAQGGAEFKVGGGTATKACNGQTGFTETLPTGKSETGVFAASGPTGPIFSGVAQGVSAAVSFNIPLKEAPTAEVIGIEEGEGEAKENKTLIPSNCKGTKKAPEAVAGNLCLFVTEANNAAAFLPFSPETSKTEVEGAGKSGSVLWVTATTPAEPVGINGTWVVTAK